MPRALDMTAKVYGHSPRRGHALDLTGQRFGRLVARARVGTDARGYATWVCECACGGSRVASCEGLRTGHTKSCGCWHRERRGGRAQTHAV